MKKIYNAMANSIWPGTILLIIIFGSYYYLNRYPVKKSHKIAYKDITNWKVKIKIYDPQGKKSYIREGQATLINDTLKLLRITDILVIYENNLKNQEGVNGK